MKNKSNQVNVGNPLSNAMFESTQSKNEIQANSKKFIERMEVVLKMEFEKKSKNIEPLTK